ncbi:hypothetical protein [Liquorilactobacillus satsumensis]|uniref:DNA-directed RNA polymerase beta subunit n=1 Tax=Liquorilactobacillus satsumensis DSM 16230 = JCM 12392 TaxID=1423801 RepID=A0A0R1UY51_9LACO|nr:hypothetical protein [Liquorilactobacillus satsumensis]KRL98030.1 hypothetical protein FD50_GL000989 [Liquorilactobacillus satsumensis DSM 16230 = JCM 12392]
MRKKDEYRDYSLRKKPITEQEARFFFDHYYQDRGMLKWQGFYLSDHTAAMKQEDQTVQVVPQEEQSLALISKRLKLSWQYQKAAVLQLREISHDNVLCQLKGIVTGYNEEKIIIRSNEGTLHSIDLEEIRNVGLLKTNGG